jgi:hypothetical protein
MKKVLYFFATLGVVALLTSCGKAPEAEIAAAKAAVDSAKVAQVDIYVPDQWTAMNDTLNAALATIEAQKSKLFRKYDAAKAQLISVVSMSTAAKQATVERIAALKVEIDTLLVEVKALVDENTKLIAKAPRGKGGAAAVDAIKTENAAVEAALTEASTMYAGGELLATVDKLKAAKEKALGLKAELEAAIAKTKR